MVLLWRRADDDGVVRKQVAERRIGEILDMPVETVRKTLRYLDAHGYIRRVSGHGRTRSHYAVVRSFSLPILDPLAPPPDLAGAQPQPPAGPGPGPAADGTGHAGAHSQPPAPAREQAGPAGAPPAARPPTPAPAELGQAAAGEASAADTTGWCADAILAGQAHKNRRCCHTTARQIEKARRREVAAAALAREQGQVQNLGITGPGNPAPADIVAQARAARAAGKIEADERARQIRERKHLVIQRTPSDHS